MSAQQSSTSTNESVADKGKGKVADTTQDTKMDQDDSSSEEEVDETEPVADEADDDNMEEIDTDNIIPGGRRTRGREIDFKKADAELPAEDDEEEDDEDFEGGEEDEEMN